MDRPGPFARRKSGCGQDYHLLSDKLTLQPDRQALAASGNCAVRCWRAALTKPANNGCPSRGVEVNSGWNCVATNHGCPGSSMISTRSSFESPEKRNPDCV